MFIAYLLRFLLNFAVLKAIIEKSGGFWALGIFENFVRGSHFLNHAVSHIHDFIGNVSRKIHFVGYDNRWGEGCLCKSRKVPLSTLCEEMAGPT